MMCVRRITRGHTLQGVRFHEVSYSSRVSECMMCCITLGCRDFSCMPAESSQVVVLQGVRIYHVLHYSRVSEFAMSCITLGCQDLYYGCLRKVLRQDCRVSEFMVCCITVGCQNSSRHVSYGTLQAQYIYICVYIHIYIYMYVCMYVCIYIFLSETM